MATQLSIVNKVLRRLREDTVTGSTDNDYAALIAEFVSEIHQELVDDWEWEFTKHDVRFDVVAGQTRYNLSAAINTTGDVALSTPNFCLPRSEITKNGAGNPAAYYYNTDTTEYGAPMMLLNDLERARIRSRNSATTASNPVWFSLTNDGEVMYCDLAYIPDTTVGYCYFTFYTKPGVLEVDGTTDDTVIKIPERPLYLGAYFLALNERGEEMGEPGMMAEQRYLQAKGVAIESDMKHNQLTNQYDWVRA